MPSMLLFPVDRDTHDMFCRLQSNVDAASLFQTNHVVHWNAPREDIFFPVWCRNVFIFNRAFWHVYHLNKDPRYIRSLGLGEQSVISF